MKQRNIPIDGVGIQLHIDISYYNQMASFLAGVKQNIQRYASIGIKHFSTSKHAIMYTDHNLS